MIRIIIAAGLLLAIPFVSTTSIAQDERPDRKVGDCLYWDQEGREVPETFDVFCEDPKPGAPVKMLRVTATDIVGIPVVIIRIRVNGTRDFSRNTQDNREFMLMMLTFSAFPFWTTRQGKMVILEDEGGKSLAIASSEVGINGLPSTPREYRFPFDEANPRTRIE